MERYRQYSRTEIHEIFTPDKKFVEGAGKWGLVGIVEIPQKKGDFIFFVTFGQSQSGHQFKDVYLVINHSIEFNNLSIAFFVFGEFIYDWINLK